MALHEVERLLFHLNTRAAVAGAFGDDPAATVAAWDGPLEAAERRLLLSGDIAGLYRHGVHPVLLAVAAPALGVQPEQARAQLKHAFGLDDQGRPLEQDVR